MPPTPASDEELVALARGGDPPAFAELIRRHEARVYHICLRVVGEPEGARDAAQEALISCWRKLSQFRGDAAFTTWLYRITVNACFDHLRAERRQPLLHVVGDDDRELEPGPPMPDHAERVATAAEVAQALRLVPDEFRAALVLADVEDLPYEEIAAILDVPVGTVKSRVHRGRVTLARAMAAGREPGEVPRPSEEQA